MFAPDIVRSAIKARGMSQKTLAERMGVKESHLSRVLKENLLRAQEMIDAAEVLGYHITLIDKRDGEALSVFRKGTGPRVRKQINGTLYDTQKANALCRTDNNDGWWMELYQTTSGKFFVAHYTDWDDAENFITICPKEQAASMLEMYGEYVP